MVNKAQRKKYIVLPPFLNCFFLQRNRILSCYRKDSINCRIQKDKQSAYDLGQVSWLASAINWTQLRAI